MKLHDIVNLQQRLEIMRRAIATDTAFPDCIALGSESHPQVHQLMLHFNRDDELGCRLLNPDEVEFIGDVFNAVLDNPHYKPSPAELLAIRALNLKLALCAGTA